MSDSAPDCWRLYNKRLLVVCVAASERRLAGTCVLVCPLTLEVGEAARIPANKRQISQLKFKSCDLVVVANLLARLRHTSVASHAAYIPNSKRK